MEAALIRPVLRRLFWLAAEDRGLLSGPLEPPGEDLLAPIEALGLDHRNLGAAGLGAAYTALLGDSERKTTGSYYTPPELVERLLDSALEPVLDQTGDRPAALLAVTICDPACGAGHFLVAAARRIARRLPGPGALREVIRHCVYGVDVNPIAVELTKMASDPSGPPDGYPGGRGRLVRRPRPAARDAAARPGRDRPAGRRVRLLPLAPGVPRGLPGRRLRLRPRQPPVGTDQAPPARGGREPVPAHKRPLPVHRARRHQRLRRLSPRPGGR
ncbi:MAG TPA: N-6 DNA methylase [Streptosporangiaceae bacterium]|nr:N-6 DNA methylase [Streptosporangiaceae bacterium]